MSKKQRNPNTSFNYRNPMEDLQLCPLEITESKFQSVLRLLQPEIKKRMMQTEPIHINISNGFLLKRRYQDERRTY